MNLANTPDQGMVQFPYLNHKNRTPKTQAALWHIPICHQTIWCKYVSWMDK
jgi:hypothetical protein